MFFISNNTSTSPYFLTIEKAANGPLNCIYRLNKTYAKRIWSAGLADSLVRLYIPTFSPALSSSERYEFSTYDMRTINRSGDWYLFDTRRLKKCKIDIPQVFESEEEINIRNGVVVTKALSRYGEIVVVSDGVKRIVQAGSTTRLIWDDVSKDDMCKLLGIGAEADLLQTLTSTVISTSY
jgi:hypothetical protein